MESSNTEIKSVVDKINKMMEMYKRNPNSPESKVAFEKANELIQQYNISKTDLDKGIIFFDDLYSFVLNSKIVHKYDFKLMHCIAQANFCQVLGGSYVLRIYGREINVIATRMMFIYARDYMMLVGSQYPKRDRKYFYSGFSEALYWRLKTHTEETWGEVEQGALVKLQESEKYEIEKFWKENEIKVNIVSVTPELENRNQKKIYNHGIISAETLNLNKQVDSKKNETLMIGGFKMKNSIIDSKLIKLKDRINSDEELKYHAKEMNKVLKDLDLSDYDKLIICIHSMTLARKVLSKQIRKQNLKLLEHSNPGKSFLKLYRIQHKLKKDIK